MMNQTTYTTTLDYNPTMIFCPGTTGNAAGEVLARTLEDEIGTYAIGSVANFLFVETTNARPNNRTGVTQVSLNGDLSKLKQSVRISGGQLPLRVLQNLPDEAMVDLTDGGAKKPYAVRVIAEVCRRDLEDASQRLRVFDESQKQQLYRRYSVSEGERQQILISSAGGATGPAMVTWFLENSDIARRKTVLILVDSGNTTDAWIERANLINLLGSVAAYKKNAPWTFLFRGSAMQREEILQGVAFLAKNLIVQKKAEGNHGYCAQLSLQRFLHDLFETNTERLGWPIVLADFRHAKTGTTQEKREILGSICSELRGIERA